MSTNLSDDVKVRLRDPQLLDVKDPAAGSAQSIDPGDTFGEGESVFLSKEDVRVFSAEEKAMDYLCRYLGCRAALLKLINEKLEGK